MAKYSTFPATLTRSAVSVAQVIDIQPPSRSQGAIRSRAHDATSGWSTVIGSGARDLGPLTFTIEFDPAAATHDSLYGDLDSTSLITYTIVFNSGDTWSFSGLLTSWEASALPSQDPQNETADITVEPSGLITVS